MPSKQRRRGLWADIYGTIATTDIAGDRVVRVATEPTHRVRAVAIPDRSSRAEVPGQQQIDVVRLITSHSLEGVNVFSRVFWDNDWWDVVAPPSFHYGTRHVRHWSFLIRRRPDIDGGYFAQPWEDVSNGEI